MPRRKTIRQVGERRVVISCRVEEWAADAFREIAENEGKSVSGLLEATVVMSVIAEFIRTGPDGRLSDLFPPGSIPKIVEVIHKKRELFFSDVEEAWGLPALESTEA